MSEKQPPVGIIPHSLFIEMRAIELMRAIGQNLDGGRKERNYPLMIGWAKEIVDIIKILGDGEKYG